MKPHTHPAFTAIFLLLSCVCMTANLGCKKKAPPEGQEPPATASVTTPDEATGDKADAPTLSHPFLWQVQSSEGKVSHLLGTMHLGINADKEFD